MVTIPNKIILQLSKKYDVEILCHIAWVSVSWYYTFKRKHLSWDTKEHKEQEDVAMIRAIADKYNRKYWYRMITMKLSQKGIIMNHKKVNRLMRKYNLLSIIRKKKPYAQIMKATQEHNIATNILNRKFWWLKAFTKLWTDISYLRFQWKWIYLSIIKDMSSWEILSHEISNNLALGFVQDTMRNLSRNRNRNRIKWALIHSDRWFHYTHPSFKKAVEELWCIQSMSRKWNCIDNAPTESFFGHMKDEIDISNCNSLDDVKKYMKKYIFEYNNHRPQWNRKKMTPVQYRNHLLNK